MKGKLIKGKNSGEYMINLEGVGYVTTYESTLPHKLSLENCQTIERGYDLDELVIHEIPYSSSTTLQVQRMRFIHGFQKALEILGDGIFEWLAKKDYLSDDKNILKEEYNQQNEWDVEVVEQCLDPTCDGVNRKGECITTGKPKLDADGCLILKRI